MGGRGRGSWAAACRRFLFSASSSSLRPCRRRRRTPLSSSSSNFEFFLLPPSLPRRRCSGSPSVVASLRADAAPFRSLRHLSPASTRDNDDSDDVEKKCADDGDDNDDDASGNADALRAAIARLKILTEGGDRPGDAAEDRRTTTRAAAQRRDLLDVMESSPFESPSSPSFETAFDPSSAAGVDKRSDEVAAARPSLSDLLRTDIFAKSWSDPYDEGRGGEVDASSFVSNGAGCWGSHRTADEDSGRDGRNTAAG